MKNIVFEAGRSVPVWACLICLQMFLFTYARAAESLPKFPGVWLSRNAQHMLADPNRALLTQNLRKITGLEELRFGDDGRLVLGDVSAADGGSAYARQVLLCALGAGHVFIIEDHCGSATVTFGQLDEGTNYEDGIGGCQFLIWRVRLDFDDFRVMGASPEVRDSFNAGFTMLHELLHGLGYRDARRTEEIGECEELLNQARAELGLPLREQYFGDSLQITRGISLVRLRFAISARPRDSFPTKQKRRKSHYLFFLQSFDKPWSE